MSYPYYDLVQKAYNDLKAEGLIMPRDPANQPQVEEDKGLITRRAGYYVNTQRDAQHGLLAKTSGNNSQGYSVDWLVRKSDGVGWDVATDTDTNGMREAIPINGDQHPPNADTASNWRQPTAELAQISDEPTPEPTPPPDGGSDDERFDAIDAQLASLTEIVASLNEQIYHMRTQNWHGTCKMGVNMNYGMTCPPMPGD